MSDDWRSTLRNRVQNCGHRNWIVKADSAYPAHSAGGIETLICSCDQIEVVSDVLADIDASGHVRAAVYTDRELAFVPEEDVPGVSAHRQRLSKLLGSYAAHALPHDDIISKVDEAARIFRVLIIKTQLKIPYTSVFLRLDCAYWNADAEGRLRSRVAAHQ